MRPVKYLNQIHLISTFIVLRIRVSRAQELLNHCNAMLMISALVIFHKEVTLKHKDIFWEAESL